MHFNDFQTAIALIHSTREQEEKPSWMCGIEGCDERARHTSPRDGMRLCPVCWEIELDQIGIEEEHK